METQELNQIVELIHGDGKKSIVVLLLENDTLSNRLKDLVNQWSSLYESAGYSIFYVVVDECSQNVEELCVIKVPQIRVFVDGELVKKVVGIPSKEELEGLVKGV